MAKRDLIRKEMSALYDEGAGLATAFQQKAEKQFQYDYQSWYTKALSVVTTLAPNRLAEFRSYYEIDPKRKNIQYGTYVIQDFIKGVIPNKFRYDNFDARGETLKCSLTNSQYSKPSLIVLTLF